MKGLYDILLMTKIYNSVELKLEVVYDNSTYSNR